jgi:gas vesicle protein
MGERSDEVNRHSDTGASNPASAEEIQHTDDTTEIRAGIEETRAEMSEIIEAIQERLNPQHLKEQVKDQVREQFHDVKATVREATIGKAEDMVRNVGDTLDDARYGLMETIRQNPMPAALVGIGLGWLFMNKRSAPSRRYARYNEQARYYREAQPYYGYQQGYTGRVNTYVDSDGNDWADNGERGAKRALHQVQETAGNVVNRAQETVGTLADRTQETVGTIAGRTQETVGNVVSQAQETASSVANQTQEAVGYVADQAQYQAQRLEDRFQRALQQNPLGVGAVALAIGTAVGFSLPQTERENELLGEARDSLIDRAQEVAQDTLEKVQQVAGDVMDQAQTTAQEKAKERGLTQD